MKKTALLLPVIAAVSLFGAGQAQAFGGFGFGGGGQLQAEVDVNTMADRFQSAMQAKANLFGIALADIKTGWVQGKSAIEVAKEKGLTDIQIKEKLQAERDERTRAMLQAMVTKGYLTQAEADARLAFMKEKEAKRELHHAKGRSMGKGEKNGHFFQRGLLQGGAGVKATAATQ
jgi:hypothetical protein